MAAADPVHGSSGKGLRSSPRDALLAPVGFESSRAGFGSIVRWTMRGGDRSVDASLLLASGCRSSISSCVGNSRSVSCPAFMIRSRDRRTPPTHTLRLGWRHPPVFKRTSCRRPVHARQSPTCPVAPRQRAGFRSADPAAGLPCRCAMLFSTPLSALSTRGRVRLLWGVSAYGVSTRFCLMSTRDVAVRSVRILRLFMAATEGWKRRGADIAPTERRGTPSAGSI